jgi:outer membrane protein OmpA-like peptidoglycan-associated protein
MNKLNKVRVSYLGRLALLGVIFGAPGPVRAVAEPAPALQVTVTPATAKAIQYQNLAGSTRIGFRGTLLLPEAKGRARILARPGKPMRIRAKFEQMKPATGFGAEYLTYVLWAVTPAGRPENLGEVIVRRNGRADLDVQTALQTFGLIVTAEPHFAVARVSNLVVLENVVTKDTRGQVEEVEAHYELLPREAYMLPGGPLGHPTLDPKVSPYVRQAYNAMRIARAEDAPETAPEAFGQAMEALVRLEAEKKQWKRPAVALARQVVQLAEDARLVAAERTEEARLEQARKEAEAAQAETERARAQAEAEKLSAVQQAQQARERAEAEAQRAREQTSREVGAEKLMQRRRLREQLDRLLETRETDRGLVVSLSDLLFPTGRASLSTATREKLAKVAGVLLPYPGVRVSVEGHADATGRAAFNQRLSLLRAQAVRDYLLRQGLAPEAVTAKGFGSALAQASNETPAGRQQNRRVELVLTGPAIGF